MNIFVRLPFYNFTVSKIHLNKTCTFFECYAKFQEPSSSGASFAPMLANSYVHHVVLGESRKLWSTKLGWPPLSYMVWV